MDTLRETNIIFGAPGCGKTKRLMDILEDELKTTAPERIAYVSFTKKGAEEGLSRAREKFSHPKTAYRYFRTIHSICFQELKLRRGDMLGKRDYKEFSKAMGMQFVGHYTEEFFHSDDRYLHLHILKKNNELMYNKFLETMSVNEFNLKFVTKNYERYKTHIRKYDFTDLLTMVIHKKIQLSADVAIIDEAQDLTTLQWKACEMLFANVKRLYIAGDDDQAIYEWSGADVNYFLNIKGKRTILDKSWRLRKEILAFSKQITAMIENRVEKNFEPLDTAEDEESYGVRYYNDVNEIDFSVGSGTWYCLGRNNYHLKSYTEELKKQVRIFTLKGKCSVSEGIITAINYYDAYRTGTLPMDKAIFVKQYLKGGIVNIRNTEWYDALSLTFDEIFYYRKLVQRKKALNLKDNRIQVNTIHGVKGGEADNVVLLMDVTKTVYNSLDTLADSELRCLYVAVTRAKKRLHIVHAKSKYSYYNAFKSLELKTS